MTNHVHNFVWYELMVPDIGKAIEFYGAVIGWNARDAGVPGFDYKLLYAGERMVAGLMALNGPQDQAGWLGYVGVADVDASVARILQKGGTILMPADDIPNIGRYAVVADPQGAVFALFQPNMDDQPQEEGAPTGVQAGAPGWHELYARDGDTAFDFYEQLFGWKISHSMDMGEMGQYRIFTANDPKAPGMDMGGLMTAPNGMPPHWGFYFVVSDFQSAVERVKAAGGAVVNGPMQVPGGQWIANCRDPQGVYFSLSSGG